jgi:peroxiredoxin
MEPPYPTRGDMMPDLDLTGPGGRPVRISDYRQRKNLVLLFMDGAGLGARRLLRGLAFRHEELVREDTEVMAVSLGPEGIPELPEPFAGGPPFRVLADDEGGAHRAVGASPRDGEEGTSLFILDRYGQIFAAYGPGGRAPIPPLGEILDWVRFIESECPE